MGYQYASNNVEFGMFILFIGESSACWFYLAVVIVFVVLFLSSILLPIPAEGVKKVYIEGYCPS